MANIDRRTFLRATTAIAAGAVAPDLARAADNNNKELMATPSPATPHVTKTLASYIVSAPLRRSAGKCAQGRPAHARRL